jgi:hypothetical protein
MRILAAFAAFVVLSFVACGSSTSSGAGPDGGSTGSTDQCSELASQVCHQAATCSAGGDAGVVFILNGNDAGVIGAGDFTMNTDESGCERFLDLVTCKGDKAAAFIANCSSPISSGSLKCGPSADHHGTGLFVPAPCAQNL